MCMGDRVSVDLQWPVCTHDDGHWPGVVFSLSSCCTVTTVARRRVSVVEWLPVYGVSKCRATLYRGYRFMLPGVYDLFIWLVGLWLHVTGARVVTVVVHNTKCLEGGEWGIGTGWQGGRDRLREQTGGQRDEKKRRLNEKKGGER